MIRWNSTGVLMTTSAKPPSQYREAVLGFLHDLKFAIRSLWRAKGLASTVVVTLALGI
jgi:hypothetical protein